nr:hypothetical protein [Candidatus Aenigmarchaeota archaeon]
MNIQASKFPLVRRFLAFELAILLAVMPTFSLSGGFQDEPADYEKMTLNQLKAEYNKVQDQISQQNKWLWEEKLRIYGNPNQEYRDRVLDSYQKIKDLDAKIKTKDLAINRELASVETG